MSERIEMRVDAGEDIGAAARRAIDTAGRVGGTVNFDFNGVTVVARPGDSVATIIDLWAARREAVVRGWRP